jgi:hypothetical protein
LEGAILFNGRDEKKKLVALPRGNHITKFPELCC